MRKVAHLPTVLAILLLALSACGENQAPQPAAPTETVQLRATALPDPTAVPTAAPTSAPPTESLPVPKTGVLASYTATIEVRIEVVKPEPALAAWSEMRLAHRLRPEPAAYSVTIVDKTGSDAGNFQLIAIGPESYFYSPEDQKWLRLRGGQEALGGLGKMVLSPDEVAGAAPASVFSEANLVARDVTAAGVITTHYRSTGGELAHLIRSGDPESTDKVLSGQADFWVANQGGYLKQYRLELLAESADGGQTRTTLEIVVGDEDKALTIEAPAETDIMDMPEPGQATPAPFNTPADPPDQAVDPGRELLSLIPAPPGGEEMALGNLPDAIKVLMETTAAGAATRIFVSDAGQEEVREFYATVLARMKWELVMDQPGQVSISYFENGAYSLMIQVQADPASGQTVVVLQVP